MSRRNSGGELAFPLLMLLFAAAWAHRSLVPKVGHCLLLAGFASGTIYVAMLIIKLAKRIRSWRGYGSPTLLDIDNMTGLEFERYVAQMLRKHGYNQVRLTEKYDLGVDIIACKDGITWGVQAKRYSGLVGADAVRQAVTALPVYHCDKAMVITNSLFSGPAQTLAVANGCTLIDQGGLRQWSTNGFGAGKSLKYS
jgi:HJR/Mrr/RecB family endonuclease